MALAPWVPEVSVIFRKKSSLPSFLPCLSNRFHLGLGLVPNISQFPISCSTLWNLVGEISPSCSACEMILAMLSNLLWASSLIASCFSCFTVKILKDFRVMAVARKRSRLVLLKAIPTGNPTPLANAAIDIIL